MSTKIDIEVVSPVSKSVRARQLEAMFDIPSYTESKMQWKGEIDLDFDWHVGLIVGPSGSGKSTLLDTLFPQPITGWSWMADSVIDNFSPHLSMDHVTGACSAVGFNTIPAWLRPFRVLSNGEQFRVYMARLLAETPTGGTVVADEFTSVVDRQVAQITSHGVQKYVRTNNLRFVAASCHYDIIEWLRPDWILHMPTLRLERRSLRPRPRIAYEIVRVDYSAWELFAPFHYMSADLNRSAKCYCLFVDDRPVSFCATMHFPHAHVDDVERISRLVTLPDWQGLGFGPRLTCELAARFKTLGKRLRMYAAHPSLTRTYDRSDQWALVKRPGVFSPRKGETSSVTGKFGGRPCAVFEYTGPGAGGRVAAHTFIHGG